MSRLIDADALLGVLTDDNIVDNMDSVNDSIIKKTKRAIQRIVAKQPTIEAEPNSCEYWDVESHFCALRRPQAEPVRRGRWYIPKDYPSKTYRRICTACQDVAYYCGEGNYRYCPNCGAKMEGVI